MKKTALITAAIFAAGAAQAEGNGVFTLGNVNVDAGQEDRTVAGAQGVIYRENGMGMHYDLSTINSDSEDTLYAGVGLSSDLGNGLRGKVMLGGSGSDEGYFPTLRVDGEIEKNFGADRGLIARAGLTYSEYEGDSEEARIRGEIVHYGKPNSSGTYVVNQVGISFGTSLGEHTNGWESNISTTYIMANGWSAGLGVSAGQIAYDTQLGAAVENDFWAVRPQVGYRINDQYEVFARGEYVDTDAYDLKGATLGLTVNFK